MRPFSRAIRAGLGPTMATIARVPPLRRAAWRAIYNLGVSKRAGQLAELDFFNWGYEPLDPREPAIVLDPSMERYRESIQLYHHVASQVPLANLRLLEVGCGRGGGAAYVKNHLGLAEVVGLDLAEDNIAVCRRRHQGVEGLSFEVGDAEELPFLEQHFDAVLNVESSHCYPSRRRFFSEVRRVLRPGGAFLYCDIIDDFDLGPFRMDLQTSGLVVVRVADITLNVLRSRETVREAALEFTRDVSPALRAQIFNWAAVVGSTNFESLKRGRKTYLTALARAPSG